MYQRFSFFQSKTVLNHVVASSGLSQKKLKNRLSNKSMDYFRSHLQDLCDIIIEYVNNTKIDKNNNIIYDSYKNMNDEDQFFAKYLINQFQKVCLDRNYSGNLLTFINNPNFIKRNVIRKLMHTNDEAFNIMRKQYLDKFKEQIINDVKDCSYTRYTYIKID